MNQLASDRGVGLRIILGVGNEAVAGIIEEGESAEQGEFGRTELSLVDEGGRLMAGLPESQQCWMSHRDCVFEAPPGFVALAASPHAA